MKTVLLKVKFFSLIFVLSFLFNTGTMAQTKSPIKGVPDIQSAGALEFSPDGILFVGDWVGAAIFAFDLGEGNDKILPEMLTVDSEDIDNIDLRIAEVVGASRGQITINDIAVHPKTQETYFSVTRGHGLKSRPAIIKLDHQGNLINIRLAKLKFTKQILHDVPDGKKQFNVRGFFGPPTEKIKAKAKVSMKTLAILDIEYYKGELFVAGISNEEFSSTLRRIPYPFTGKYGSSQIKVYHVVTDSYISRAPIRALVVTQVNGKDYLIAGYSCTPIVIIPLDKLKDGAHVKGRTVAELGPGHPLDMFIYKSDGKENIVISDLGNTTRIISVKELVAGKALTKKDYGKGFNVNYREGVQGSSYPMFGVPLQMDIMKVKTMLKGMPMETSNLFVGVARDPYTGNLNYQRYFPFLGIQVSMAYGEPDFPGGE